MYTNKVATPVRIQFAMTGYYQCPSCGLALDLRFKRVVDNNMQFYYRCAGPEPHPYMHNLSTDEWFEGVELLES